MDEATLRKYAGIVLKGLAQRLDTKGLATYSESGAYPDGVVPITFGRQHPTAGACVTLADYIDQPGISDRVSRLWVQVRIRHPHFFDGRDLVGGISAALHRQTHVDLGQGVVIGEIVQTSFVPLGEDSHGRFEWSLNFKITGLRPLPSIREGAST